MVALQGGLTIVTAGSGSGRSGRTGFPPPHPERAARRKKSTAERLVMVAIASRFLKGIPDEYTATRRMRPGGERAGGGAAGCHSSIFFEKWR
jgi:hypothetical protein